MAMNRVLGTLLLLSCLCVFISALPRPRGCRDKQNANTCRYYSSNGYCRRNNNNWFSWMKSNCAKACGFCSVPTTEKTSTTPSSVATTIPPVTTTISPIVLPGCSDKYNANCRYYSFNGYCRRNNNNWFSWMKSNCAKACGLCAVPTTEKTSTTSSPVATTIPTVVLPGCRDKHDSNSCRYYASIGECSEQNKWFTWMKSNCAKACGLCSVPTTEKTSTTTSPVATTIPTVDLPGCRDKHNTKICRHYSSNGYCKRNNNNWFSWMKSNCVKTCGLCAAPTTGCRDKHNTKRCRHYATNGYCSPKNSNWFTWMKSNCAKTCVLCSAPTTDKTTTSSPVATTIPPVKGCTRDKHNANSCRYYATNGFCSPNHNNWFNWMKLNCAKTCGLCSVPTTGAPSQQQWFQIHSTAYDKCLALTYVSRRTAYRYFTKRRVSIFMNDCTHPSGQLWRWTSRGQLQSSLNQQCLAVTRVWTGYLGWRTGLSMQPCNSVTSEQEWVCSGGFLKVKKLNSYLVPYISVSGIRRVGGVRLGYRSQLTDNTASWTRYGTSKSICAT